MCAEKEEEFFKETTLECPCCGKKIKASFSEGGSLLETRGVECAEEKKEKKRSMLAKAVDALMK